MTLFTEDFIATQNGVNPQRVLRIAIDEDELAPGAWSTSCQESSAWRNQKSPKVDRPTRLVSALTESTQSLRARKL